MIFYLFFYKQVLIVLQVILYCLFMMIYYYVLTPWSIDVSKKEMYAPLTNFVFETKEDLLVTQMDGSTKYIFYPKKGAVAPSSAVDKIVGVVPKGTQLQIVKIKQNPLDGSVKGYYARVDDKVFSRYKIDARFLFRSCCINEVPEIYENYLQRVSQIEVTYKEGKAKGKWPLCIFDKKVGQVIFPFLQGQGPLRSSPHAP